MRSKNILKYLGYLLIMAILYYYGNSILAKYYEVAQITFIYNYGMIAIVQLVFFGGIGLVLGLDRILLEIKNKGKWKFDITRLIILGIPSLFFSIHYLVLRLIPLHESFGNIFTISSIVFGYTLISSLYKSDK